MINKGIDLFLKKEFGKTVEDLMHMTDLPTWFFVSKQKKI